MSDEQPHSGLFRSIAHRLAGSEEILPDEGRLPSFGRATTWLNSEPLTPQGLRGRVVVVDFWTYTCVNWLRTLPYLRAWHAKYADAGLTIVGVHTPEFDFERDLGNVVAESQNLGVEYPIAVDSDYGVWNEFANHYWPAIYIADAEGRLRYHHFGEGEYPRIEMVIQRLLVDAGARDLDLDLVMVEPEGLEVAADWALAAVTGDLPRLRAEQRIRVGGRRLLRPRACLRRHSPRFRSTRGIWPASGRRPDTPPCCPRPVAESRSRSTHATSTW